MSNVTYWFLVISAILASIASFVIFVITKLKVNKIKFEYSEKLKSENIRPDNKLLDNKQSYDGLIPDDVINTILNSIYINEYNTFFIPYLENKYIYDSFIKLSNMTESEHSDIVILKNNFDINRQFDEAFKKMNESGMLFILEAKKDNNIKELITYLKTMDINYDYVKSTEEMIIVVK